MKEKKKTELMMHFTHTCCCWRGILLLVVLY
jgi:hypothetical protein